MDKKYITIIEMTGSSLSLMFRLHETHGLCVSKDRGDTYYDISKLDNKCDLIKMLKEHVIAKDIWEKEILGCEMNLIYDEEYVNMLYNDMGTLILSDLYKIRDELFNLLKIAPLKEDRDLVRKTIIHCEAYISDEQFANSSANR